MGTTTLRELGREIPCSETHWRDIAAKAHRSIGGPGSEAAATTHEGFIRSIRRKEISGTSRHLQDCPRCLEEGHRYLLLEIGDRLTCGACHWPLRD